MKELTRDNVQNYLNNFNDMGYEINDELKKALLYSEFSDRNIIVSGGAGTGKSTFIKLFMNNTSFNNVALLSSTGISAINIGGVTVHSFFSFGIDLINKYAMSQTLIDKINMFDAFVVDEISMIRADVMEALEYRLRNSSMDTHLPFGGKKMIFVGDLFQLAPVVKKGTNEYKFINENFKSPWWFSAPDIGNFDYIELKKNYRQENDDEFLDILNRIRIGKQTRKDLEKINSKVMKLEEFIEQKGDNYVYLTTTNKAANKINTEELSKIDSEEYIFYPEIKGTFPSNLFPVETPLRLKLGAKVVFVRNGLTYKNGDIGRISYISKSMIKVELLRNGIEVNLSEDVWENNDYVVNGDGKIYREVIGSFRNYPLKLAYAITVHKSQGQTYDNVYFNIENGAFSSGQTYVALSRSRTLDGLGLKSKIFNSDIIVDRKIRRMFM